MTFPRGDDIMYYYILYDMFRLHNQTQHSSKNRIGSEKGFVPNIRIKLFIEGCSLSVPVNGGGRE